MFENKACEVLKIRSLLFVNDWFQNRHNAAVGHYRRTLNKKTGGTIRVKP